jgi:hypothetical protein
MTNARRAGKGQAAWIASQNAHAAAVTDEDLQYSTDTARLGDKTVHVPPQAGYKTARFPQ